MWEYRPFHPRESLHAWCYGDVLRTSRFCPIRVSDRFSHRAWSFLFCDGFVIKRLLFVSAVWSFSAMLPTWTNELYIRWDVALLRCNPRRERRKDKENTYGKRLSVLWSSAPWYRRVLPPMWQATRRCNPRWEQRKDKENTYGKRLSVLWSSAPRYRRVLPPMWQANRKRPRNSSNSGVRMWPSPQGDDGKRRSSTTTRVLLWWQWPTCTQDQCISPSGTKPLVTLK